MAQTIETPLTKLLGIKYPVMLAGMNVVAGPELAAAVSNAGGLGSIGGVGYTPKFLRNAIKELKAGLREPDLPFGIDLLLPQVGGSARKTNTDYTGGKLPELIDIIIESGATLFISAVGIPPRWAVDKLHAAGIPVMNMIGGLLPAPVGAITLLPSAPHGVLRLVGSVRHVQKCLDAGVDLICAQGGEGGGHTGAVATTVLLPQVVDAVRGRKSALTGQDIMVVGAGGVFDGRGLAACLSMGAQAVWVGTRFICATEAGGPPRHKKEVVKSTSEDTVRTIIYTGRPMRILKNDYALDWEHNRQQEIKDLTGKGILPVQHDVRSRSEAGEEIDMISVQPLLSGQAAGAVTEILPAKEIIEGMVSEAVQILKYTTSLVGQPPANPRPTYRQASSKL